LASLIQGFEYDIFISYRHNDNRSAWVTHFVAALQEELAGTIKDTVSIYFDKNPHDGLLDLHDVDRSLEGKLKCLIFIPILSQTYCDEKSFAWRNEFCAFNKLSKTDEHGGHVKLNNRNVTRRILPVKIHDLDPDDQALLEKEIGGPLRSIDFIYRGPGVNRPLTKEDEREQNAASTSYRDQINKTANHIKELIQALTKPRASEARVSRTEKIISFGKEKKIAFVCLFILALAALLYARTTRSDSPNVGLAIEKSIAVLPFADMSAAHDQEYFADGVSEEIINVLAQSEDMKVIARSSSFQFKGKNEDVKMIGEKLGVATLLEGSVRKSGDQLRISAQLVSTIDGSHLWSKTFDRSSNDVFVVQDEIALAVAGALKSKLVAGATTTGASEWNEEAKKEYYLGMFYFNRRSARDYEIARPHFERSLQLDSTAAVVYPFMYLTCVGHIGGYSHRDELPACNQYLDKALAMDPTQPETRTYNSFRYLYQYDFVRAEQEMKLALKYGPRNPIVLRSACRVFSVLKKHDEAIKLGEQAIALDPMLTFSYYNTANAYARLGQPDKAITLLKKARAISNDYDDMLVFLLVLNEQVAEATEQNKLNKGDFRDLNEVAIKSATDKPAAKRLLKDIVQRWEGKDPGEPLSFRIATAASMAGEKDLAFVWLERTYDSGLLMGLHSDPYFASLRDDNRYKQLIKRINFPN
jgi:TolB-like protein